MQYLSLRDAMEILRAGTLRERGGGRQARAVGAGGRAKARRTRARALKAALSHHAS
jgi:hypothetical protein